MEEKMNHELITFIVPMYNVERYLKECLDSIQQQTYPYFECIMVNDGSTDSSEAICREFVNLDNRFHYFEKEQEGISSARNLGIECSKGEYITFVDSKDWVEEDYLEVLYQTIRENNADIAISNYKEFDVKENCFYIHAYQINDSKQVFTQQELLEKLPQLENLSSTFEITGGKLVKKSLLSHIRFDERLRIAEGMDFWSKLYLTSEKIAFENKETYTIRWTDRESEKLEMVRTEVDDMRVRMNRILLLTIKGYQVSAFVESLKLYFAGRIEYLEGIGLAKSNVIEWVKEQYFLFTGKLF